MLFQIPKGLYDILPYEVDQEWKLSHYWQYLETVIRKTALDFGFKEIRTPTFEKMFKGMLGYKLFTGKEIRGLLKG